MQILSAGSNWNPDYEAEFAKRVKLHNAVMQGGVDRAGLMNHYRHNLCDWIDDWCITFDPRKPSHLRLMPFKLFPRQREFVDFVLSCKRDKESGLGEKSRDMGATWLACAISVGLWIFEPGTVIGWGSRKAEYVDKIGDPKAIFPKMRQIIEYLPRWQWPKDFNMRDYATYMRIVNPANGCVIAGEAGDSMGRGGRTTLYFKDESAHYENPESIEASLGDNTDTQIDMSSVNGSANPFYRRRMAGEVWYPGKPNTPGKVRVFIFDWRDNPLKTQEWYDRRRRRAEEEGMLHIFAQEVDRDYAGSVDRVIIPPAWARAAVDAHIKLGFKADGMKSAGQDVADGGKDKNALVIMEGVVVTFADHWAGDAGDAAKRAVPDCQERRVSELYYDSVGVGAGFKTEIKTMRELEAVPKNLRVLPWNGGGAVMDPTGHIIPDDHESPTNEDQYLNLKAQGYFRLRARFYKTWRAVMHGAIYDSSELISISSEIPVLQELLMQLSQPVHKLGAKGKTVVDKQPDGSVSPNLADALNICANPNREASIYDAM